MLHLLQNSGRSCMYGGCYFRANRVYNPATLTVVEHTRLIECEFGGTNLPQPEDITVAFMTVDEMRQDWQAHAKEEYRVVNLKPQYQHMLNTLETALTL